jgi:hypothetical protein
MTELGAAPDGGDEIGAMPWDSHIVEVDELAALIVTLAKPDQPREELTSGPEDRHHCECYRGEAMGKGEWPQSAQS